MKKFLVILLSCMAVFACTPTRVPSPDAPVDVDPSDTGSVVTPPADTVVTPDPTPEEPAEKKLTKPAVCWVDAAANFVKLGTKEGVNKYLDLIQGAGLNGIVLDVKPVEGTVLYDSEFLVPCGNRIGSNVLSQDRDYDFVPYFIEETKRRGMRLTLSATILTMGTYNHQPDFGNNDWDELYCKELLPTGLQDIRKNPKSFCFLNPAHPKVKEYVLRMVSELARYDVDGLALDYCRFMNYNSDFSDVSREAFEKWLGRKVENWPDDIYRFEDTTTTDYASFKCGSLYNDWMEWRAWLIRDLVADIRTTVKAINPNLDIEYWADCSWPRPDTGQNWASPSKNRSSSYWWTTNNYYKTGFADQLDIFQLGAYRSHVWDEMGAYGSSSIQWNLNNGRTLVGKDCRMYGTFSASVSSKFQMADACYLCLKEADGMMIFDLCYLGPWWDEIKKGIDRYIEEFE